MFNTTLDRSPCQAICCTWVRTQIPNLENRQKFSLVISCERISSLFEGQSSYYLCRSHFVRGTILEMGNAILISRMLCDKDLRTLENLKKVFIRLSVLQMV